MSAIELIKQVAALPERERTRFEQLFKAMKTGSSAPDSPSQSNWPDFGERLRDIYGDRFAPDSRKVIDGGRGER